MPAHMPGDRLRLQYVRSRTGTYLGPGNRVGTLAVHLDADPDGSETLVQAEAVVWDPVPTRIPVEALLYRRK